MSHLRALIKSPALLAEQKCGGRQMYWKCPFKHFTLVKSKILSKHLLENRQNIALFSFKIDLFAGNMFKTAFLMCRLGLFGKKRAVYRFEYPKTSFKLLQF